MGQTVTLLLGTIAATWMGIQELLQVTVGLLAGCLGD